MTTTPITDSHAFHRITGITSPDGDVVGVTVARELEKKLNEAILINKLLDISLGAKDYLIQELKGNNYERHAKN